MDGLAVQLRVAEADFISWTAFVAQASAANLHLLPEAHAALEDALRRRDCLRAKVAANGVQLVCAGSPASRATQHGRHANRPSEGA